MVFCQSVCGELGEFVDVELVELGELVDMELVELGALVDRELVELRDRRRAFCAGLCVTHTHTHT